MEEKYTLWFLQEKTKDWKDLKLESSYEDILIHLKEQLELSINCGWRGSLFKICRVKDKSWLKYVPDNIRN